MVFIKRHYSQHGKASHKTRKRAVRYQARRKNTIERVHEYVLPLVRMQFFGQSSKEINDQSDDATILNLGLYLSLIDKVVRKYTTVTDFTTDDEEFLLLLQLVATKRKADSESTEQCFQRLKKDSKTFERIYHARGVHSEVLKTKQFWGTRQQLLCGKVISDWIEEQSEETPMDPIFGALLCPCGGRVGPGDSGWVHSLLYDQNGYMAYHSAVHDAFGYLITFHSTGPGYDYLKKSMLAKVNPLSGQYDGISFWRKLLAQSKEECEGEQDSVLSMFRDVILKSETV